MMQCQALQGILAERGESVWKVLVLDVKDAETIQARAAGRWVCRSTGHSYHIKYNPPKSYDGGEPTASNMRDDVTGEALTQRQDDTPDAIVQQMHGYYSQIVPIIARFECLQEDAALEHNETQPEAGDKPKMVHRIDADDAPDRVWARIRNQLS